RQGSETAVFLVAAAPDGPQTRRGPPPAPGHAAPRRRPRGFAAPRWPAGGGLRIAGGAAFGPADDAVAGGHQSGDAPARAGGTQQHGPHRPRGTGAEAFRAAFDERDRGGSGY